MYKPTYTKETLRKAAPVELFDRLGYHFLVYDVPAIGVYAAVWPTGTDPLHAEVTKGWELTWTAKQFWALVLTELLAR